MISSSSLQLTTRLIIISKYSAVLKLHRDVNEWGQSRYTQNMMVYDSYTLMNVDYSYITAYDINSIISVVVNSCGKLLM